MVLPNEHLLAAELDVLLTTTSFSVASPTRSVSEGITSPRLRFGLVDLDIPILQAVFCSSSENVWAANIAG